MRKHEYAPPHVSDARHLARRALIWIAKRVRKSSDILVTEAVNIADRMSRPRCIYPGCRHEVANWMYDHDDYMPIDTSLCELHYGMYHDSIHRFVKHPEGFPTIVPDADGNGCIIAWAQWHHHVSRKT